MHFDSFQRQVLPERTPEHLELSVISKHEYAEPLGQINPDETTIIQAKKKQIFIYYKNIFQISLTKIYK